MTHRLLVQALVQRALTGSRVAEMNPIAQLEEKTLNPQTRKNLLRAMHGEAFAFVKYSLFAQQARQNGREELALMFEKSARLERIQHFAEVAELAGLVGDDYDNLCNSIQGVPDDAGSMYREFAKQATAAGDTTAAARFAELDRDELERRSIFKGALQELNAGRQTNVDMVNATGASPLA